MARSLAACALPALAIAYAWLRLEDPARAGDALVVVALASAPALLRAGWQRVLGTGVVTAAAAWFVFGSQPWELLPFRDQRVLGPLADEAGRGVADFYDNLLPFAPVENPEMHALVLAAIFGFALGVALLVASRRPVGAAALAVAGIGWPATLVSGQAVGIGALALAAALSIPLVLRARSGPALAAGAATAAVVVAGAAWASSATEVAREAALDWETWDIRGAPVQATGVRVAWDSNYDGLTFPPTKTVVLTVEGPERPQYWRTSTLDFFTDDHWFENLFWLDQIASDGRPLPSDALTPPRAERRASWIEQEIEIRALVDDRLAAAGTPRAIESDDIGRVFVLSGGMLRARDALRPGRRYQVWSYAPDPAPSALARSRPRYPAAVDRYLRIEGRETPFFGLPGRDAAVRGYLSDPSYAHLAPYRAVYEEALRVTRAAATPYAAVLALESWFRRGGFLYDESPPRAAGPPLVAFVTRTKAGYCQHYAGAMALMLRMLGIPARVAVGFTSGTRRDGKWVVTDHEAHAWVEVWFAGHGWVPFDPTPGRGTFGGRYSFASDSEAVVEALDRGDLRIAAILERERPDSADLPRGGTTSFGENRAPSLFGIVLLASAAWMLLVGLGKWIARRLRYLSRDPRRAAAATRLELEAFLRDQGIEVPARATLEDLRLAVARELGVDGAAFADAAARARFGPPADAQRRAGIARRELRALLKRARFELSLWDRFRGFVSLRSLRAGVR